MRIDGEAFSQLVERAVEEIERSTDAEVVVVCAHRSGSYRDIPLAAASVAALVLLVVIEVLPFPIEPWAVVADLVIAWFATAWVVSSDRILRLLTSRKRLLRQVAEAAAAEFHSEAVHATPNRTGVLIYVSALERRVEVIADIGIEARVARGRFAPAHQQPERRAREDAAQEGQ